MSGLTQKQQAIVDFIRSRIEANDHPTVRDIAAAVGIKSPNGAARHLELLAKKGVLYRNAAGKLVLS